MVGLMPYYNHDGWGTIHWACVECLVRPMCNERCNRTYYKHYLCEPCNECDGFPCKEVKKLQMYETIFRAYGDQIFECTNKYFEERSIFKLLKP
jgi:hypothetical protein